MRSAIIFLLLGLAAPVIYGNNWDNFKAIEANMNQLLNNQINVELQGHYTYLQLSHKFYERTSFYPKVAAYFRAKADEEMQHAERFIQYQNQRGGQFKATGITLVSLDECNNVKNLREAFLCAQNLEIFVTKKLTELTKNAMEAHNVAGAADSTYIESNGKTNPLLRGQSVVITTVGGEKMSLKGYLQSSISSIEGAEYIELAEMVTHEFLGHQIEDTKEIANYLYTLEKFHVGTPPNTEASNVENLASYMFDKNI